MTAIVLNTTTGAVTEYDWAFESITPARAGSDSGFFTLGGDADAEVAIAAEVRTGKPGGGKLQSMGNVYLALSGAGTGELIVEGRSQEWIYPVVARASGVSRAVPGKGISESYLAFGYRNVGGADFRLDRLDAEVSPSTTRRF